MGLLEKFSLFLNRDIYPEKNYLCDFNRIKHELKPADVILIEGRSRIGEIIKRLTNSAWTHSALYVGRLHDIDDPNIRELIKHHYTGNPRDQLIIESLAGSGTIVSSLESYNKEHIRICRPTGLHYNDVQHVIMFAAEHLGYEYDSRHFFDLGRFYLRSKLIPRRWLSYLFKNNPKESDKEICSTLIGNAFRSIKFPILPLIKNTAENKMILIERNTRLLTPSDFDYSPYFNIIKYPIIPDNNDGDYKRFPWSETLIAHDENNISEVITTPNDDDS
jgi:hypothetical protein